MAWIPSNQERTYTRVEKQRQKQRGQVYTFDRDIPGKRLRSLRLRGKRGIKNVGGKKVKRGKGKEGNNSLEFGEKAFRKTWIPASRSESRTAPAGMTARLFSCALW